MTKYTAPHSGLARVVTAARAVGAGRYPREMVAAALELDAALKALDQEGGMLASKEEVQDAFRLHGYRDDVQVDVDRFGSALVSHGDDGYWVSGWVFVSQPEAEDDQ